MNSCFPSSSLVWIFSYETLEQAIYPTRETIEMISFLIAIEASRFRDKGAGKQIAIAFYAGQRGDTSARYSRKRKSDA